MDTQEIISEEITFDQVVSRGCGLDVHKKEIVATIWGTGLKKETRTYLSTTRSLTELREWLLKNAVSHVAMESTGVYWKPVFNILEPGGFTLLVVNARHIKYVQGHKTDKKDSRWICKLLLAGLLKATREEIQAAVEGNLSDHHRFMLTVIKEDIEKTQTLIDTLDVKISELMQPYADFIAKLSEIPGVGEQTAKALIAEIGTDMSVFPTDAHIASRAGVCPGNNESAGKKKFTDTARQ